MSSLDNPAFGGRFFKALSGDFMPPTDPLKHAHSLGALAITTVSEGRRVGGRDRHEFMYAPPWAGGVRAKVSCLTYLTSFPDREPLTLVEGIALNSPNTGIGILNVYDTALIGGQQESKARSEVALARSQRVIRFPLELEEQLVFARDEITKTAQEFFDAHVQVD